MSQRFQLFWRWETQTVQCPWPASWVDTPTPSCLSLSFSRMTEFVTLSGPEFTWNRVMRWTLKMKNKAWKSQTVAERPVCSSVCQHSREACSVCKAEPRESSFPSMVSVILFFWPLFTAPRIITITDCMMTDCTHNPPVTLSLHTPILSCIRPRDTPSLQLSRVETKLGFLWGYYAE